MNTGLIVNLIFFHPKPVLIENLELALVNVYDILQHDLPPGWKFLVITPFLETVSGLSTIKTVKQ